jgi:16S rRNA (uracil1498-N3)-methyltransferase
MRVPRLYLDQELGVGERVALDARAHRHATQVLRLRAGAQVLLFNGDGHDYPARLETVERRSSAAVVESVAEAAPESGLELVLVQAISKGEHMDLSLQKAVELGVRRIVPVHSERSVGRLEAERRQRRLTHWQGVLIAACEQSGRARLPALDAPRSLGDWLSSDGRRAGWVLDPRGGRAQGDADLGATGRAPFHVLIGPEGGLTESEIAAATAAGLCALRLGPRILRTETAAIAALTAAQLRWGDFSGDPDAAGD